MTFGQTGVAGKSVFEINKMRLLKTKTSTGQRTQKNEKNAAP